MEPVKVVARYLDGKRLKGFSQDFFPNKDRFHIYPAEKPSGEAVEVLVNELKAMFFVRDFVGNFQYDERKNEISEIRDGSRQTLSVRILTKHLS
jgi:hypothetical protein